MTAKNNRDRLAALRTIIPAILAMTLMGAMPNWVELARANGYYSAAADRYENEILGEDGACADAEEGSDFAVQCQALEALGVDTEDEDADGDGDISDAEAAAAAERQEAADAALAQAVLSVSPKAAQSAASNPASMVFSGPSAAVTSQVGGQMANRRDGASGFSVAGIKVDHQTLDGELHFFEDSAAGADLNGRLGGFVNGVGGFGDHTATDEAIGFDFSNGGIIAGLDYQFSDQLLLGIAVNWITSETTFDGGLGGVDKDTIGGSIYTSYTSGNLYIDTIGNYSSSDHDLSRNIVVGAISETATASYDSQEIFLSVGGGYKVAEGALSVGPVVRFDLVKVWVDGYTESGSAWSMNYDGFDITSFSSNVGGEASYSISTEYGVLKPEIRVLWVREFANDAQALTSSYVSSPGSTITTLLSGPDRNFIRMGGGFTLEMTNGISAFFDYETLLGFENITSHQFSVGGRIEFSGGP